MPAAPTGRRRTPPFAIDVVKICVRVGWNGQFPASEGKSRGFLKPFGREGAGHALHRNVAGNPKASGCTVGRGKDPVVETFEAPHGNRRDGDPHNEAQRRVAATRDATHDGRIQLHDDGKPQREKHDGDRAATEPTGRLWIENKEINSSVRDGAEAYYDLVYRVEGDKAVKVSETRYVYDEKAGDYIPEEE